MALHSPSRGADFSLATSATLSSTYPTITTPLILPRDWSDHYYLPSASDSLCGNYDFQSNHLDRLPSGILPSLAGLGIKNVDLEKDSRNKDTKISPYSLDSQPLVHAQDSRRHSHRNHRTEAIYDDREYDHGLQSRQTELLSELNSPWSFSAILRAAEFPTDSTFRRDPCSTLGLEMDASALTSQLLNGTQILDESDGGIDWSFERLSAATGLSVAEFAAQISATAETTLRRMGAKGELNASTFSSLETSSNYPTTGSLHGDNEPLKWLPGAAGRSVLHFPSVDINLRSMDVTWRNMECVGVNPADILPNNQDISSASQLPSPLDHNVSEVLPPSGDFVNNIAAQVNYVPDFDFDLDQSISRPDPGSPYPYALPTLIYPSRNARQGSDDDAFQSPSSSEHSPFLLPAGSKRNHPSRPRTRGRISQTTDMDASSLECENDTNHQHQHQHLPPINLGTPVFDAHRGIHIEELKAKAERYRLRNQGRDYDKRWLIAFAGKLTTKGELLDEFRCYIAGCKQANKRRDHILIHVGAHLDQRPFKCMHCTARFLRKNECKRHELSHTGIRPFACHLCPLPATTFVRQDLLKRHMKRTHRQEFKSDKENEEVVRPKKRARVKY